MIIGVGVDQIEVSRLARKLDDDAFLAKVFSPAEIAYCQSKGVPAQSFAARFAAKEAFLKALGKGLFSGIDMADISIVVDDTGNPSMLLQETALRALQSADGQHVHVSLTHLKDTATAFVVVEK